MSKMQQWRVKNPLRYAYGTLKNNSKRRGKEFNLTFQQFKEFAIKTDYINKKGRTGQNYHIDRIDETKGYTTDNIQCITNTENVKKYIRFKYRDQYGAKFETVIVKESVNSYLF